MSNENGEKDVLEATDSLQILNVEDCGRSEVDKKNKPKVDILLKPTGNAPIMKKKKWTVDSDKPIGWIIEFIKKYLKIESKEKLFVYVNQTFAPAPDQLVKNLYDCYSTEGKLVLHYCKTQAWG
ncbi:unnamed protein product [Brassicogethes aeneus]|uniref:Ubiquitin-like protein ATG12 n=1 Tax=Brassicogethes aeneus TaxID=1431903 RepID=A0A9P0FKI9_BRAAE|nr:unnamed protein product [Brassicogethes aeneus]